MADEEDVPPLEDMSEAMERIVTLRDQSVRDVHNSPVPIVSKDVPKANCVTLSTASDFVRDHTDNVSQNNQNNVPVFDKKSSPSASNGGYGGLKKGFLFSSGGAKKQMKKPATESLSVDSDKLEMITPKNGGKENQLRFEEVQQAMRLNESLLQNKDQWLTEDLLSRIQSNPGLCEQLLNPATARAMAELQTNPEAALNNPVTANVMKEFSALLGDHFTTLADKQEASPSSAGVTPGNTSTPSVRVHSPDGGSEMRVISSTDPRQQREIDDQRKVDELLAQPEIKDALLDKDVQRILAILRSDPDKGQEQLRSADASLLAKIRKLIGAGLLKMDR